MTIIITEIEKWQALRKNETGKTIGFVPTMGHLHAGHLSLCERAQSENEIVVMSIFVNPTQFNQVSDLEKYPRTIEKDMALLQSQHIDYVFLPHEKDMYPDHYEIKITEDSLSMELEGEYRPGHFNGMLTIVLKLLNLVQPTRAYFGEKDYQQLLLVKKMVSALFLTTDIVACPTVRNEKGLPLSSRNSRLNAEQQKKAAIFSAWLQKKEETKKIIQALETEGFKVDYIAEKWNRRLGAVWLDEVRLIDNISIQLF